MLKSQVFVVRFGIQTPDFQQWIAANTEPLQGEINVEVTGVCSSF